MKIVNCKYVLRLWGAYRGGGNCDPTFCFADRVRSYTSYGPGHSDVGCFGQFSPHQCCLHQTA